MLRFTYALLFLLAGSATFAQDVFKNQLFSSQEPLNIRLEVSFKELKKETNDSTYMDGTLHYQVEGSWDSIEVELKKRGHFRLDNCFFTPIRIKVKKKKSKGTLFEGNKPLKLVLPCERTDESDELVLREFLCYKIYEQITPYTFGTRRVNLELVETSKKTARTFNIAGFLIEDDDIVAKRHDAEIRDELKPHPLRLHDTTAVQHALFQYLIGNLDWSTTFQHNAKVMITRNPIRYIPLAYDFDHSGFVNAPYAKPPPGFDIRSVTQRVYRGFCRENNALAFHVRDQYIAAEPRITGILEKYKRFFSDQTNENLRKYVATFYATIKDEKTFEEQVLNNCRTE